MDRSKGFNKVKHEAIDGKLITKCPHGEIDAFGVRIVAGSTCNGCEFSGGMCLDSPRTIFCSK